MRNFGVMSLLLIITIPGYVVAQGTPALKADAKASEEARHEELIRTPDSKSTATVSVSKVVPLFGNPEPIVVATWDGGKLTNEEVSATLATRQPSNGRTISPDDLMRASYSQQVEIVKNLAWEQILLEKAKKSGLTADSADIAKSVTAQEEALLNRLYYNHQIIPELNEMTRTTAHEYYDANKDTLFTRPAETSIRAIHVSTYEMVTTEKGDTLEDLAIRITGDAGATDQIRDSLPPYYMRKPASKVEDKVLSSPLKAGEVLFVPVNKDAVSSATKLAENLREKLVNGENIDEVVKETSKADFPVSATQSIRVSEEAGYWPELIKAADSLKETSVSQIVKTPTGLNILMVEDRTTTSVVPFESVEDELLSRVTTDETQRRQTVEKTRAEVLDRLWKKYNVELNKNAISRPNYLGADPLSTDTVIAKAGNFVYNLEQFLSDLRMTGKDWGQLTENERIEVAKVAPRLTNYLIAREAREQGLQNSEDFKKAMKGITDSLIVAEYKKRTEDPEDRHVTNAELIAYYNDHLDRYTSAAQVSLREISKRINMTLPPATKAESIEKAKQALTEIRSRITNEEDFAQLARRESEAISTRSRGGLIGTVPDNFRGEAFKNQVRQLKPGEVSEPFLYGSEVMIIRLDNRTAPTVQPFEDVRKLVMRDYAATEPAKTKNQQREKILKEANFQIKF